jgi:hypothetical protein
MNTDRELKINAVSGDNEGFVEITEDELTQVAGGAKLPGMHKAADVTLTRGLLSSSGAR